MRLQKVLKDISSGMTPYQMKPYKFVDFFPAGSNENYIRNDRKNLSKTIYKLKKQGFIKKVNKDGTFLWKLTRLGLKKLQNLNKKFIPRNKYKGEAVNYSTIIAFDIPEKLKHLRSWIRYSLAIMGFEKLQRSLWIGKVKIPEDFIKDLYKLKINNCVVIFKVIDQGLL